MAGSAGPLRALGALILLAAAVHAGALLNGFTFDDPHIVVENPLVTEPGGILRIPFAHYWAGSGGQGNLYRPLTLATYWLNHRAGGTSAWAFHLVNVLLHAAVTGVVYLLARRLAPEPAALAAAILFAVHPVHTEAVANVAGRAELLAALFVLSAWLLRRRAGWSLALFALGLLSKENAIVLPGLLMLEDLPSKGPRASLRSALPHAVAAGVWLAARTLVVGAGTAAEGDPFLGVPAHERILTAVSVLGREVLLMVAPIRLSADYSFDQIPVAASVLDAGFLAGLAALAACGLAAAAARTLPCVRLGIAGFFVCLLPVSNLLFGIGVMMAERLLYLPSALACLAAGGVLERLSRTAGPRRARQALLAVSLALAAAGAWRTADRVGDWFDQVTLFEATVKTSPRSALAWVNLGAAYQELGRLEDAERCFREAASIAPARPGPRYNLAVALEKQGRLSEAIEAYREALRLAPSDART
ncbi:MAG TPA: tetratricopeptide repeat protein, partial [Candidatus Polarisedimenticolia bacterium]|nr:tetratricopeptide repeat protein [Candidatus Polarisedimenticolia bacterium]